MGSERRHPAGEMNSIRNSRKQPHAAAAAIVSADGRSLSPQFGGLTVWKNWPAGLLVLLS